MQMQIAAHIQVMAFDLCVNACMTSKLHDSPRHSRQQQADSQAPAAHGR